MSSVEPLGPGRIEPRELEQEMRSSFLDYAMSVIVARALPGRPRRAQACPPARALRDARGRPPAEPAAPQVRPCRRRRHGLVPPTRRRGDLRHARPHGAAVLDALPARRRPGELRQSSTTTPPRRCGTASRPERGSPRRTGPSRSRSSWVTRHRTPSARRPSKCLTVSVRPVLGVEGLPFRRPSDSEAANTRGLRADRDAQPSCPLSCRHGRRAAADVETARRGDAGGPCARQPNPAGVGSWNLRVGSERGGAARCVRRGRLGEPEPCRVQQCRQGVLRRGPGCVRR